MTATPPDLRALLASRRLLVTAGAGGVGKTTTAAALALQAALDGRRAAVLTIDPARRLAQALGLDQLTGELRPVAPHHFESAGLAPKGELWAMMLDTATTGDQMVARFAPDAATAAAILANPYYKYFSTSLAGAQEYMAVEQVRALVAEGRFDVVILDTPPATHALDFLDAPDRLIEALDSSAVQALVRGRQRAADSLAGRLLGRGRGVILKSLDRLTGGPFLEDLTEFLSLFGSILDALKTASKAVSTLLRAPSTGFLLVTSPTRSNVDEAVRFHAALAERGFPFGAFVANRVHFNQALLPPAGLSAAVRVDLEATLAAALAETAGEPVTAAARAALIDTLCAGLADHNRMARRDAGALQRLNEAAGRPPVAVPLLPLDVRDLGNLAHVGDWLLGREPRP